MNWKELYVAFEEFITEMKMPALIEEDKIYFDKEQISQEETHQEETHQEETTIVSSPVSFYSILEKFIIEMKMPGLIEE